KPEAVASTSQNPKSVRIVHQKRSPHPQFFRLFRISFTFFSGDLLSKMFLVLCLVLGIMASVSGQPHARASDLYYTDITPVTDETRYTTLNPDTQLTEMNKVKHSKGNIVFTAGERASGDRLIVNHYDDENFPSAKDVEVLMSYPAGASTGVTLTSIEVYVDMAADDAGGYLTKGGIGQTNVEILLTSNQTRSFVYETFIYGY
ncbi:uncharacterized protein LOC6726354, partial [Drosophila simulans]|uniref:uncharacterized protein LOC6726354 n=1 Tax=Drosophila simulans TaxID=7240 RepID=UPI00192CE65E